MGNSPTLEELLARRNHRSFTRYVVAKERQIDQQAEALADATEALREATALGGKFYAAFQAYLARLPE